MCLVPVRITRPDSARKVRLPRMKPEQTGKKPAPQEPGFFPVPFTLPKFPASAHSGACSCTGNSQTVCDHRLKAGPLRRDTASPRTSTGSVIGVLPENFLSGPSPEKSGRVTSHIKKYSGISPIPQKSRFRIYFWIDNRSSTASSMYL